MPRTPLGTMASKYGHGSGDISSFYGAAQRVSCPNRPFPRWADVGQRKNGRSGGQKQIETGCAWAILGGIPSGWGQFGAVKKWAVVIGGLRRQLNALYTLRDTARFCDRLNEMCSAQSPPWKNAPCLRGRLRRPLGNKRGVRRGLWAVKIHEATTVPTSGP